MEGFYGKCLTSINNSSRGFYWTYCNWIEYDNYDSPIYRFEIYSGCISSKIKIFDKYDVELNLGNKSLINDSFTKIQEILLLNILLPPSSSN